MDLDIYVNRGNWFIIANLKKILFVVTLLSDICSLRSLLCVWDDSTWRKKPQRILAFRKDS